MGGQPMKRHLLLLLPLFAAVFYATTASGQAPHSRVLAFYSTHAEPDHVQFAEGALKFFAAIAPKDNFTFDATTDWENLNDAYLKQYQLIIWLNGSPTKPEQRRAFEKYMETGGAGRGWASTQPVITTKAQAGHGSSIFLGEQSSISIAGHLCPPS